MTAFPLPELNSTCSHFNCRIVLLGRCYVAHRRSFRTAAVMGRRGAWVVYSTWISVKSASEYFRQTDEDGIECNSANLIINHGWHGLLVDGNEDLIEAGIKFYQKHPSTRTYPPVSVHSWITRGNVNDLLVKNGFQGEIDLLSIDMDGVDYWIWEAINCVDHRVVVVEYQDIIGAERACTVPYSDSFNAHGHPTTQGMPNFAAASLPAFVKLARSRGYRSVGCNRYGFNAFFVKNGRREKVPVVKDFPWVDV